MPCWHHHCSTASPQRTGCAEPPPSWHVQLLRACSSRNARLAQRVPLQQLDPSTAQPTEIYFQIDATWPTTATLVGTSALERTMARGRARRALGNQVLRRGPSSVGVPLTSTPLPRHTFSSLFTGTGLSVRCGGRIGRLGGVIYCAARMHGTPSPPRRPHPSAAVLLVGGLGRPARRPARLPVGPVPTASAPAGALAA